MQPLGEKVADQNQHHDSGIKVYRSWLERVPEHEYGERPQCEVGKSDTWAQQVRVAHSTVAAQRGVRRPDKAQRPPISPRIIEMKVKVRRDQQRADHESCRQARRGDGIAAEVKWETQ